MASISGVKTTTPQTFVDASETLRDLSKQIGDTKMQSVKECFAKYISADTKSRPIPSGVREAWPETTFREERGQLENLLSDIKDPKKKSNVLNLFDACAIARATNGQHLDVSIPNARFGFFGLSSKALRDTLPEMENAGKNLLTLNPRLKAFPRASLIRHFMSEIATANKKSGFFAGFKKLSDRELYKCAEAMTEGVLGKETPVKSDAKAAAAKGATSSAAVGEAKPASQVTKADVAALAKRDLLESTRGINDGKGLYWASKHDLVYAGARAFAEKEFSGENFEFFDRVAQYRMLPQEQRKAFVQKMCEAHVEGDPESGLELPKNSYINFDAGSVKALRYIS
jgi:hypothetical protein